MTTTVRENILANLVATCQGITAANGFHVTVAAAERFEVDGNDLVSLPACIISTLDQTKTGETNRSMEWDLQVRIDAHIVHNKALDSRSTDAVLTELAGDLYKAVMADRTRGGHAIWTTVDNMTDFDLVTDEGQMTGVMVSLTVQFRHAPGNPEQAV